MVFYMNEDYNYIIDGDIEIINEMKSKSQYAWDKWKKHYNFKPFKTDKTGRVGTIEVDGRTIKVDMRKNKYEYSKKTMKNKLDEFKRKNIVVDKKNPNIGYYVDPDTKERTKINMSDLKKEFNNVKRQTNYSNMDKKITGDKQLFRHSFKNAKTVTDHEIGHLVDSEQNHGDDFDKFLNNRYFHMDAKKHDKSDEVDHANTKEFFADNYAAHKSDPKLVARSLRQNLKDIRKEAKDKDYNKQTQVDLEQRLKALKDPELAKYKSFDCEKKDYGKGIIKNNDSKNVSKKHRNMNQEAQEKKKKFNK